MRSIVVYYSYTGKTHHAAQLITNIIKGKGGDILPVRIRPLKEEKNFLMQCAGSFFAKKPELYRTLLDLKNFDRIIIGSPVWAFKPAPALNTFLDKCSSMEGKSVICFVTYASGAGKNKALELMKKNCVSKGARVIGTLSFGNTESDEEYKKKLAPFL